MSDDHSEVVPLLPIPNRTVKRFCADDSAGSRVKVGHRQTIKPKTPSQLRGRFFLRIEIEIFNYCAFARHAFSSNFDLDLLGLESLLIQDASRS